jgi:DNA-directed RNA polymerase delta subunit
MAIVHLIDLAYEIAQKEYKDGTFSFNQLYTQLNAKTNLESHQQSIGEVYCELLQDPRFTYIGDKK